MAEAPVATAKKSKVNNPYTWGTGRRKAAVARVRIKPGEGKFIINKKEVNDFFRLDVDRNAVRKPLDVTDTGSGICGYGHCVAGGCQFDQDNWAKKDFCGRPQLSRYK